MFGDEDKENSTSSWDYETETESINTQMNGTSEEGILEAIKDSLNYVDENKRNSEKQTNVPIQIASITANVSSYNASDNDGDDDDNDDDEEISLLDFFFKGESAFTSTTLKPLTFNVTGIPLPNGMTNSPMQIQPILPENIKNESLQFSMLPISLYNMVKEDGSFIFDSEKTNQTHQSAESHRPEHLSQQKQTIKGTNSELIDSEVKWQKGEKVFPSTIKNEIKTITPAPKHATLVKKVVETSTEAAKLELKNNMHVRVSNQSTKFNKTENSSMRDSISSVKNTTQNVVESVTMIKTTASITVNPKPIPKLKPTKSPLDQNHTKTHSSTPVLSKTSSKKPQFTPTTITSTIRSTTKAQPNKSTTNLMQPLTTKSSRTTTVLPKITAVQINSNPSILETDISYDYSEPTLPPSLPNLKIIPFLPTDAVKNIIHKNDEYKSNYNYYQPSSDSSTNTETHAHANTAYSPFNLKPTADKYPVYNGNIAEDRIDYDSYKMPSENLENLDYINVYAGGGANLIQPASFQLNVNSKLDYIPNQTKIPITINKNLTVKPPLPPFEPEHEYDLYNLPPQPQPQFQSGNGYNEYSVNVHAQNEPFSSEHNYNVPHFVTMPPMKELPHRPDANKDSIFSYGNKNKFIPPARTEGMFLKNACDFVVHLSLILHLSTEKIYIVMLCHITLSSAEVYNYFLIK